MSSEVRLRFTGMNMAIALAVLVIPLILVVAMCQPDERTVSSVNAADTYRNAAELGVFPVLSPHGLGNGWRPTVANSRTAEGTLTVRVTYFTPTDNALQFVQSNQPADDLLADPLGNSDLASTEQIAGKTWQRYQLEGTGDTALVLLEPDQTLFVAGDAHHDEIRRFIEALKPTPVPS